ncbi:Cyclin like protein [Aduncisulcus paluster]|uniref:Cyclin like protein n=1 Tax=Aduncisulcus paluster TaxID=2918883 RepID=A0ABQ5K1Z6_9EUKA|nr:Cyclin like protein [Aduncisulcus paluster]
MKKQPIGVYPTIGRYSYAIEKDSKVAQPSKTFSAHGSSLQGPSCATTIFDANGIAKPDIFTPIISPKIKEEEDSSTSIPIQRISARLTPLSTKDEEDIKGIKCSTPVVCLPDDESPEEALLHIPPSIVDIDSCVSKDIRYSHEIAHDLILNMIEKQHKYLPSENYSSIYDGDVKPQMIRVVVNWIIEVVEEFELSNETYYLATSMFHRFLSKVSVSRKRLQLIAVTCLFIASKIEEVQPPVIGDYEYITDHAFSREEIIATEALILKHLDFCITVPNPRTFLRRFCRAARMRRTDCILAYYLCEISQTDATMMHYPPSMIAAAAVSLALQASSGSVLETYWSHTLCFYTTLSFEDIHGVREALRNCWEVNVTKPATCDPSANDGDVSPSLQKFATCYASKKACTSFLSADSIVDAHLEFCDEEGKVIVQASKRFEPSKYY